MAEVTMSSVPPTGPAAERPTRIIWAAHILKYLSGDRCHTRSGSADIKVSSAGVAPDGEDPVGGKSDSDDDGMDTVTERAAVLSRTHIDIQRTFLDALAELLSPRKGWDHVTATSLREHGGRVTITVSRNDAFGRKKGSDDGAKSRDLLATLSMYLSRCDSRTAAAEGGMDCEAAFIEHSRDRVLEWLNPLRHYVEVVEGTKTAQRPGPLIPNSTQKQWQLFYNTAVQSGASTDISAVDVVSQAYALCASPHFRLFLNQRFGERLDDKISRCLRFLARPLSNCRLLSIIAKKLPQYQNVRFELVTRDAKKAAPDKSHGVVGIPEALRRLFGVDDFKNLDPSAVRALVRDFGDRFLAECTPEAYSQHAEIQNLEHHWSRGLWPTLDYIGCSKKTCLLCEDFLSSLDPPISTRGRHGVCYPAWGVPRSNSQSASLALKVVEKSLVMRIRRILSRTDSKKAAFHNVSQSTIVSGVTDMIGNFDNMRLLRERVRDEGSAMREQQDIV
jgi:hypothetical protein